MENEETKHLGVLGTASKCAGAGIGTVAKVTAGVKNLLTRPIDEELDIDSDEQSKSVCEPKPETQGQDTGDNEPAGTVARLEAELARTQSQSAQMESEFASQINTLQTEKDSLIFDLEQAAKEVNDSKNIEATLRARVIALESELDAAKGKSGKPYSPLIHAKPLLSEVDAALIEQNPDISEKMTAPEDDVKVEAVIEKPQPESVTVESGIAVSEETEDIEAKQADLPVQNKKEFAAVQTEQEVEPSMETTDVQSDEQEQTETSSSVPADVTIEEVNAADFDSATEKIIFINALSGISSPDRAVRVNAVKVVAGIRHKLSVRTLVGQMAKESTAQIRAECIKALVELNMKEGVLTIENALSEQAVLVRLAAVRGLYRLGGAASASKLIRMLCDEDADVRRRTATCIGWLGKEELAVELVPLLDDSSVSVRLAAVEAMGNLRSRKVVSSLIEHLSDSEKTVCRTIISALETITGKKRGGAFPRDEKSLQFLIIRWCEWWKDEPKV
ncbi:HEAT repeat domain-containing protein [Planctomycetota bacterium]